MKMSALDWVGYVLLVVGGLNLGLWGFFEFNLLESLFTGALLRVVYALIGLSALWSIWHMAKM